MDAADASVAAFAAPFHEFLRNLFNRFMNDSVAGHALSVEVRVF